MLKKLFINIIIGPILYESIKYDITEGEPENSPYEPTALFILCSQIFGYGFYGMVWFNYANIRSGEPTSTIAWIFLIGWIISMLAILMGIWGPIFGIIDRIYGIYKLVRRK